MDSRLTQIREDLQTIGRLFAHAVSDPHGFTFDHRTAAADTLEHALALVAELAGEPGPIPQPIPASPSDGIVALLERMPEGSAMTLYRMKPQEPTKIESEQAPTEVRAD